LGKFLGKIWAKSNSCIPKTIRSPTVMAKGPFRSSNQAAICYYQFNHSKVEAITLSALPKDTTSELFCISSHYLFFMLNVNHGSCEYQLLKSFGLTRPTLRLSLC